MSSNVLDASNRSQDTLYASLANLGRLSAGSLGCAYSVPAPAGFQGFSEASQMIIGPFRVIWGSSNVTGSQLVSLDTIPANTFPYQSQLGLFVVGTVRGWGNSNHAGTATGKAANILSQGPTTGNVYFEPAIESPAVNMNFLIIGLAKF